MRYRSGYSLVELLVTMAIVGVFLAVVLPSFRASVPEKSIEQATSQVQSYIRSAYTDHWSVASHTAGVTFTKPNIIEIWRNDPSTKISTHYLPDRTNFGLFSSDPSLTTYSIKFDQSKTFNQAGVAGNDILTIQNPDSSTHSTIEVDRITGVVEARIKR